MASNKEIFQCEKCGNTYTTIEEAIECEKNSVSPFKYEIGDVVAFEFESRVTGKRIIIAGVVEQRWLNRYHKNMYKLRIIDKNKGLIACRSEDQILRKV